MIKQKNRLSLKYEIAQYIKNPNDQIILLAN